ncbi:MAG TPA: MBL fold metallo-hydrolase [Bryobacterales bacterium]|jgi:L-ascorbate metabolism protein UlaG (beta-lactamase superfamily)|nr:MBL fold metallo-hydrolase [Bryobacterales bacterium]
MAAKSRGRKESTPALKRRAWLGRAGLAGIAGAAGLAYGAAPRLWNEMARETLRPVEPPPERPRPFQWPSTGICAAWLGHSTVLLRIGGCTILTDPIFSERAGVSLGPITLGIKRLVAPALSLEQLPKIDLILLSHAHMDHFDLPSLARLGSLQTTVITAPNTSDLLRVKRYRQVRELRWGERFRVGPVECRAIEVKHWGARMRSDTYRGYNGYLIEAANRRVLFAGDTAHTSAFRALRDSRPIDLAIMPIGSYEPWIRNHCTPEQAWQMGNDAGAEYFLPVHHQTFRLSREPLREPIERFFSVAANQSYRIRLEKIGQEFWLA